MALDTFLSFDTFYKEHMSLTPSELSLSEAESNVLLLLSQHESLIARKIEEFLKVDRGYLSRILNRLGQKEYIERVQDKKDKRIYHIKLTNSGKEKLASLESELISYLEKKYEDMDKEIVNSIALCFDDVMSLYNEQNLNNTPTISTDEKISLDEEELVVRTGTTGDTGYVLTTHSDFYQYEHGFNAQFISRLLEEIVEYNKGRFKAELFILWRGVERIGSIIVVIDSYNNAQLGWFMVDDGEDRNKYRKKLIDYAFQYCINQNVEHVFTTTLLKDPEMENLLETYGFIETNEQFSQKWKETGTIIKRFEINLKNEQN